MKPAALYRAITVLVLSVASCVASGQSVKQEPLAEGLGVVWALEWLTETKIVFTEREGTAGILDLSTGSVTPLSGLPEVYARGQGGLLDVAIAPNDNGWLYFTYSKPVSGGATTALARAKLDGTALVQWQELLVPAVANSNRRHYGSRIAFDGKGFLFYGIGDLASRPNGQDPSNLSATIIRLTVDGEIPADNPFVGDANMRPEIWSYGHRNPQGLCFDNSGNLWSNEHGPRGGDEINLVLPGKNYGWADASYGKEYALPKSVGKAQELPGMESPKKVYIPSIAPSDLLCYQNQTVPAWANSLFSSALRQTHINQVKPVASTDSSISISDFESRLLDDQNERIRSLLEAPDGTIIYGTDSGKIVRLSSTGN
jgi:glucose/arabinose dehydrogenase